MFHLQFEEMMDRLEKNSGQTVVTLNEAKSLLKQDNDYIIAVYDYWLNKRLKMASFSVCLLFLRMPFYLIFVRISPDRLAQSVDSTSENGKIRWNRFQWKSVYRL
jgi:hypothetical protein